MEFAESTDKEKPIPKELTAFLNEVQNNLGLYPETVIYNRIKKYVPVIPRKQIAWLTQTVIISTEFRVRILSIRCKSGDKLACEMLDLAVNGDEYSKNPTVQKGLMGLFRDENDIESGKLLVEIGVITQEQYDKELRSRKQGDLIDGKSYPDLLNDLAAESKKYPTADSFSMAMIMGKLESVPSPNTANVYKLIRGKYKTAEDFYNAVKKGEFELKKTEERKERIAAPEEAVSKPLVIKGVEDLELMKKEIQDKISEEKKRRLRGGGMAGEPKDEYKNSGAQYKYSIDDKTRGGEREVSKKEFESEWIRYKGFSKPVPTTIGVHLADKSVEMGKTVKIAFIISQGTMAQDGGMAGEPAGDYTQKDKKREYQDGYQQAKFCFEHVLKTGNICPTALPYGAYVGAVADTIRNKKQITQDKVDALNKTIQDLHPGSEFYQGVYVFLIEKILEYLKVEQKVGEPVDPERLKVARAIATTASGPVEQGAAIPVCPQIPGFVHCPACKFKYSVTSVISCPYRPEQTTRVHEDDSTQEPPENYKLWTFTDFEPFIYNEEDIDQLGQLQGIVNLSNKLTEKEKTELHDLIDKQIGEILARR